MSDRAQRVLDALTDFDANCGNGYPLLSICRFFDNGNSESIDKDYEALTADEEKQVIQAFLELSY